jgi:RNA polymerase sigma factor FliA
MQSAAVRRRGPSRVAVHRKIALRTTADQPPKRGARRRRSKKGSTKKKPSAAAPRARASSPAGAPGTPAVAATAAPKRDPAQPSGSADAREKRALEQAVRRLWSAYRARPGDDERNRLVVHYQPFVGDVVRRFAWRLPRSVDRGDLDTAANVGLMAAIEGFDPARGVRFESYCELRVRGALLDELRTQDWLPRPWRARLEQQKRVSERLRAESNRDPSDAEIASAMEMPLEEYRQVFGVVMPGPAVGSPPDDAEEQASGLDVVPDTHGDPPGEKLTRDEILRLVAQRLTVQEYRVVYLKYWEDFSMREIGEVMDLSESRVCKIHMRLIERLKDRFRAHVEI